MKAAVAITTATIRQVLPLRRAILYLIAEAAPALVYLLMVSTLSDEAAALERLFFMLITLYFPLLVPIVTLIVASSVLGAERRDGTLSFLVLRPIPRWVIAAAKLAAAVIVAGGLNGFGALALTSAFAIETGTWDLVIPLVVGGIVASIVYSSIFVPLGFFTDRAVLIGLLVLLIFENGVLFALPGLSDLSGWRLGLSSFVGLVPEATREAWVTTVEIEDIAVELATLGTALLRTAVIAAASIGLITMVLRQRDLASE